MSSLQRLFSTGAFIGFRDFAFVSGWIFSKMLEFSFSLVIYPQYPARPGVINGFIKARKTEALSKRLQKLMANEISVPKTTSGNG
jgi:hypothetical protein